MVSSGMRADEKEVLRIAADLLTVLKYLSGLRPAVIHRDIKPENVVLEGGQWGGQVFLIDFGGVQGAAGAGEGQGEKLDLVVWLDYSQRHPIEQ
jgi:serine/threonine protein kinase